MPKISGKAGKEIAEQTGKSVAGAGDDVMSGLTKLWKASDEAAEAGSRSAEKAGKELIESTLHKDFAGDFALKVRDTTNKIHQSLSGAEAQSTSIIESASEIQNAISKSITNPKAFAELIATKGRLIGLKIPVEILEGGPDVIRQFVTREMRKGLGSVNQAKAQLHYINRAKEVINQPDGLRQLKQLLDVERKQAGGFFGSGLESKIPELRNIMDKAEDVYRMDRSGSSNIKFLQEAIGLKSDNPKMFELFIANPNNAARWTKMKQSPGYVGKMIKELDPRVSLKRKLFGITSGDTAKRLGLGVATLGTGYGAVKIYNWFGNNNPASTASRANSLTPYISNLRVRGPGAPIARSAQSSLNNITKIFTKINTELSNKDSSGAIKDFVEESSNELNNLVAALDNWDIVIQNSENQKLAEAVYDNLAQLAYKIASGLNALGGQVSISLEKGVAGKGPRVPTRQSGKNIQRVQEFIGAPLTGELDKETVRTLRAFEDNLNNRAATTKFTGLFVVPEEGFVADIDILREAYQRIQKY